MYATGKPKERRQGSILHFAAEKLSVIPARQSLTGACDKELILIDKTGGCDILRRNFNDFEKLPSHGASFFHPKTAPYGDPEIVFGINAHPVGNTVLNGK